MHRNRITQALAMVTLTLGLPAIGLSQGAPPPPPPGAPAVILEEDVTPPLSVPVSQITVETFKPCWVALISEAEGDTGEYGWWSVWHKHKEEKTYKQTPFTFQNLVPGNYTLVVYDPSTSEFGNGEPFPEDASDGMAMQLIVVEGSTDLKYSLMKADFKEWNCLSCPWLYVFDGTDYIRTTEVLQDVVGPANQTTTGHRFAHSDIVDGKIRIRLQEEKPEITYLNRCVLRVNSREIAPIQADSKLASTDDQSLVLRQGDSVDLEFAIPAGTSSDAIIELDTTGFYEPEAAFLESVLEKYSF